jgi:hypothetical protein
MFCWQNIFCYNNEEKSYPWDIDIPIDFKYNQRINDNFKITNIATGFWKDENSISRYGYGHILDIGIGAKTVSEKISYYGKFNLIDFFFVEPPYNPSQGKYQFYEPNVANIKIINYNRTGICDIDTKWFEIGAGKCFLIRPLSYSERLRFSTYINVGLWTLKLGNELFGDLGNIAYEVNTNINTRLNLVFTIQLNRLIIEQFASAEVFLSNPSIYILNGGLKVNYMIMKSHDHYPNSLKHFRVGIQYDYKKIVAANNFVDNHFLAFQIIYYIHNPHEGFSF